MIRLNLGVGGLEFKSPRPDHLSTRLIADNARNH
jgi:hypothetical protein